MQKTKPKAANSSSTNPSDWPMKKRVPAFLNAVCPRPELYSFELIDGEYCVTFKTLLASSDLLRKVVIAAHRYAIDATVVAVKDKTTLVLNSYADHPTLDDLAFACKIEE